MPKLTNYHVLDPTNVGDLLSSPLQYFDFPGYSCQTQDIRNFDPDSVKNSHIIIGGGGLLYKRFLPQIQSLCTTQGVGKRILWGVGQQSYGCDKSVLDPPFNYDAYTAHSDLVGIRDDKMPHDWVPCVSCMHPAFDKPRTIKHEVVAFSHKKFQINIPGIPRMTNENSDLEEVLGFLGSGNTILTSSFHGAYWGTLLGRRVLAFPFSSKFFTLRHQPNLYIVNKWSRVRWRLSALGKELWTFRYKGNIHSCDTKNWRQHLSKCQAYPQSLAECRERNRWFYQRVMGTLEE